MRPRELTALLERAIPAKRRVLIKGSPGVGKTAIVNQVAKKLGHDLVLLHPVTSDPTDFKGMPAVVGGKAEFLPFGDLRHLVETKRPTVAFLDDIGQAPFAVQAALMQLLYGGRVNGHRVSDTVVFVGATNDTKDAAGVAGMLEPVKSRWDTIVTLDCHPDDWCAWALANGMPHELVAFIRWRPALLNDFKPTRELKNSPCPRTVEAVGRWVNEGVTDPEVLAGAVGEGFATEFVAFLSLYASLPSPDAVLLNPDTAPIPEKPAARYAMVSALAHKATSGNMERLLRYLARFDKEYEVCAVRDALRQKPELANTAAFTRWITTNQGYFE